MITLLDGGMSRELQRQGATLKQPEWSALALMNAPDMVLAAHAAFVAAGSKVITVNSYAVVPFHLGDEVFATRGAELAVRASQLARQAAKGGNDVRVAGCLPPACGSYMPESFDAQAAAQILSVLVDNMAADVDFWLCETMSSLQEAQVTSEAARATGKPIWISFTLRDDSETLAQGDSLLRSKEPVEDAVKLALEVGAEAVLFNCSMPEVMETAICIAKSVMAETGRELPIGIYANALISQDEDGDANAVISSVRDDLDPLGYCRWADRWVAAGATLIGGCCGIDAPHIAVLNAHFNAKG